MNAGRRSQLALWAALALLVTGILWNVVHRSVGLTLSAPAEGAIGAFLVAGAISCGLYARSLFLSNARIHRDALQSLADHDELSGLYNYRYLRRQIDTLLSAAQESRAPCAVIMFDLDDFKDANDRFGHQAGDALLTAISAALRDVVGDRGVVARYGGDEFVTLLPGADRAAAKAIAREAVAAIECASLDALPQNSHIGVSASSGIAVFPDDGIGGEALIAHADRALYEAKAHRPDARLRSEERDAQDVFFAIGEAMGRSLDPLQLVNNVVRAVGRSLLLDSCAIWLVQDADELVRIRAYYVADPAFATTFGDALREEPLLRPEVMERGLMSTPTYADDVSAGSMFPDRLGALFEGNSWAISIPLVGSSSGIMMMVARHTRTAPPSMSLAEAIGRLAAASIGNSDMYARTRAQGQHLTGLAGIGGLLFGEGTYEERLGAVVTKIAEEIGCDNLTLDTADPTGKAPFIRQFYGRAPDGGPLADDFRDLWLSLRPVLNEPEVVKFLATAIEPVVMDDPLTQVPEMYREVIVRSGVQSVVVMPILWQGDVKGLFYFASYAKSAFGEQDIALMQTIAAQLAPSIQVATLHVELEHSYSELKEAHRDAILRLAYAAEARDPYTGRHLQRIGQLSQEIARRMGLNEDEVEAIGYAAIVHDLGKLRIPDAILIKPGELNDEDWVQMKKHPEYGAELLGSGLFYNLAREVALHHHERWDGSGYPFGLAGEAIPKAASIVMVADIYDALISARPYKQAWPAAKALGELVHMRGRKLCPEAVDVFLAMWNDGAVARIEAATIDASFESDFRERWAA